MSKNVWKSDKSWDRGVREGGGQGAVAPPWKLAEIYFWVHKFFESSVIYSISIFLEHVPICAGYVLVSSW